MPYSMPTPSAPGARRHASQPVARCAVHWREVRLRGIVGRYVADRRGMALVLTLFVVALITVLVLEYHFDASVEIDLAANYGSEVQAYHLALSGVNFARALLLQDEPQADGPDDQWYQLGLVPACFPPQQLLSLASRADGAPLALAGIEDTPSVSPSHENCVSLRIVDEQGKLPINALAPANGTEDPNPTWLPIFEAFFTSFQIEPDMLDSLVDWIDANDIARGIAGAENSYYGGLETPYAANDGPMHTLGELRLVRGFNDPEVLAKFFPGMEPQAVVDADLGSNDYLTAYGLREEAKVNLNTAKAEVLQALFTGLPDGSEVAGDLVDEIVAKREEAQFETLSEVNALIPDNTTRTQLAQVADVKSVYFRVELIGAVGVIQKKAVAVLKRAEQNAMIMVYFKVE
ncbi:hypothetical protein NKDENANG_00520 [Candidatus Entotheonellaceae bacterium PAL068K]